MEKTIYPPPWWALFCKQFAGKKDVRCFEEFTLAIDKRDGKSGASSGDRCLDSP